MAIVAEELYSLLVPLGDERLIVPRNCIAEVIRFAATPREESSADWLYGMARWGDIDIPVISFEAMCGREAPEPSGRTRVVVFRPLTAGAGCPPYGIMSEGFPQMVKLNREVVVLDQAYRPPEGSPLLCKVSMIKDQALIPDLELVEHKLVSELGINQD